MEQVHLYGAAMLRTSRQRESRRTTQNKQKKERMMRGKITSVCWCCKKSLRPQIRKMENLVHYLARNEQDGVNVSLGSILRAPGGHRTS